MTFPLTTLLGSLVAAIISLIGGVAMAFYTSWRLSMLAFTTVGPIVHVTQAYAQWSRDQNRRILAHLGEANAAATEALANVRTVKAMATEDREAKRYADHTMAARDRGIIDACLNALTSILTNLLDYGSGWLILFCAVWKSTSELGLVTGTTSRQWRGRPKFDFHTGSTGAPRRCAGAPACRRASL